MREFLTMLLNTIESISLWSVIDILIVSYIFLKAYTLIKETRAEQLLKGILFVLVLIPISYLMNLSVLYFILSKTITIGVLAIIIIFQPEIRRALEHIGRSAFEELKTDEEKQAIYRGIREIVTAVENLSLSKTGALIVLERNTGLGEIYASGTNIDASISNALLENIFVVNTPLHDGATIIKNNRVAYSGCVLPLTSNTDINKKLGTRHRAAIGLTEVSDALVIIVSEETGIISLAANGRLTRNYDKEKLSNMLTKVFENQGRNKRKITGIGEKVKGWIRKKKTRNNS